MNKFVIPAIIGLAILAIANTAKANSKANETEYMQKIFFDAITKAFGKLTASQIQTINQIIISFQTFGDRDMRKLCYILATAWHESKFLSIKEKRAAPGTKTYAYQEKYWYTGFYGRGFVQLTHEYNYKTMSDVIGVDLVKNPDLALVKTYAADILVIGMMEGLFIQKVFTIHDFINSIADYVGARKLVNGKDQAELIAQYTQTIISNLEYPIV